MAGTYSVHLKCRIEVSESAVLPGASRLNVEYRIRVSFKAKWLGKKLRALMTNLPDVDWRDVAEVNMAQDNFRWLPTPNATMVSIAGNVMTSPAEYVPAVPAPRG